jgi:hypothetical protein
MELDGLIKVRRVAPLNESGSKTAGEIAQRLWAKRMTGRTQEQCSSIQLDGFIQVRLDALLPEPVSKADGKIIEICESIGMSRRML